MWQARWKMMFLYFIHMCFCIYFLGLREKSQLTEAFMYWITKKRKVDKSKRFEWLPPKCTKKSRSPQRLLSQTTRNKDVKKGRTDYDKAKSSWTDELSHQREAVLRKLLGRTWILSKFGSISKTDLHNVSFKCCKWFFKVVV